MSHAAHPGQFQIGPIVTLAQLCRRMRASEGEVVRRLDAMNEAAAEDPRMVGRMPVVRQVLGGIVYFDRRYYACSMENLSNVIVGFRDVT